MWDVIVAGAGPAGSVAAYVLARNGCRVLLADIVDPKAPKIGEALPSAAVRLLRSIELPVPSTKGPHTPISGNLSSWNTDELVAADFISDPDGLGWRLDRARFDADLRTAAIQAGANYRSARVNDLERQDAGWNIRFSDHGNELARWIIDATGRRAAIGRRLGAKRLRDMRLIALYAIGTPAKGVQINRTVIEAVPRGWWYGALLPNGALLAGFHARHRDAVFLLTDPDGWRHALRDTRHVGPMFADTFFDSPCRALEAGGAQLNRYGGDGWIACGDAALSFDPISGQGIFSALYGGMTAGRVISHALNNSRTNLERYSRQLENVRRLYLARCRAVYRNERRWIDQPFWSIFSEEFE
jgi:flavin-dependent dehydrogenase